VPSGSLPPWRGDIKNLRPMLATLADPPLVDERLAYEPKYDGIRALVAIEPGRGAHGIRLWSRLGNEKTAQFPELVRALAPFAKKLKAPILLDGEIVALDDEGEPASFQKLQGRIHLTSIREDEAARRGSGQVAFIAFDVLRDGAFDLTSLPLATRRARLIRIFGVPSSPLLRLSDFVVGDGRALHKLAKARGWEGLLVKHLDSQYKFGKRSADWRKLKIQREQEFVVGGWTDPRGSRRHFGALLVGVHDGDGSAPGRSRAREARSEGRGSAARRLIYTGHVGTGFDEAELARGAQHREKQAPPHNPVQGGPRVAKLLEKLATPDSPFQVAPKGNERVHWVRPELVAQVRFTEWTDEGLLRHPTYLGLRDDKRASEVRREVPVMSKALSKSTPARALRADRGGARDGMEPAATRTKGRRAGDQVSAADVTRLLDELGAIDARGGNGDLHLPDGHTLAITNTRKVLWPARKLTKGDLFRHYIRVAPCILPVVADRPLVMKRQPNGIRGETFYQQRAPDQVPTGVRVESLPADDEVPSRLIGGSLLTLLYMTQLAAISQDPWFSRVGTLEFIDHVAIDLDPMPGVPFDKVLEVARWIHDELDHLNVTGFPKTSGSNGLHIYIPMPRETPYEAGLIFCQIIATIVASRHPSAATVERAVQARGRRVYVDYLQNIQGKTLACAYSARGSDYAGVATPLTWAEVHEGVEREDFSIETVPGRLAEVGDLWKGLFTARGANLRAVERYAEVE
jgi:bifunctional non-homologous end joining protein LigD